MSPDNPFLQALLAQPEDDTLRLAVADWLDENDQPERAEFIRVQIDLARGVGDRERRIALEIRQAQLLIAHDREWVRPLAEALDCTDDQFGGWQFGRGSYDARATGSMWGGWVFRRGFVEYFRLPAAVVNRHGEKLARLTPVRELYLLPCASVNVVALCKKPWLRSVTKLYLCPSRPGDRLNERAVRALIDCPYLESLRVLDVVAGDVSESTAREFRRRFGHQLVRSPHG